MQSRFKLFINPRDDADDVVDNLSITLAHTCDLKLVIGGRTVSRNIEQWGY